MHSIKHINVSRETYNRVCKIYNSHKDGLEGYIDQLLWWNRKINLVSRNVSRETLVEHVRHSLFLSMLPCFKGAKHIVDAGTGGGLPGIPLTVTTPDKNFLLNDIVSKKVLAVKQIKRKLGLDNVEVSSGSVERLKPSHEFLLVSKHAFKIKDLYEYTRSMAWSTMVFYKSSDFKEELQGIDESLGITVYKLDAWNKGGFYDGKAIVVIKR